MGYIKKFNDFNNINEAALSPDAKFNKELKLDLEKIGEMYDELALKISSELDMLEDEEGTDMRKVLMIQKELDKVIAMKEKADMLLIANVINKLA